MNNLEYYADLPCKCQLDEYHICDPDKCIPNIAKKCLNEIGEIKQQAIYYIKDLENGGK